MNRLRWQLDMIKRRFGLIGLLSIAVNIFAIGFYLYVVAPGQEKFHETQRALLAANSSQQMPANAPLKNLSQSEQLEVFLSRFPSEAAINATWESISKSEEKFGLLVERNVYETSPKVNAGLLHYHLNIPVKATYPDIRNFLAELIQTNSNLALSSIRMKRDAADSILVNAEIGLMVYVRAQ